MTLKAPVADLDTRFSSPGAAAIPWAEAEPQLREAGVFWLSTVRPEGRPHVAPLIGVWLDGAFYFCTGEEEQKAKNLARNPQVTITTGSNALTDGLDIVVEGETVVVTDDARLRRVADAYVAKYGEGWRFAVRDGAFYHEGGAPDRTSGWDPDEVTREEDAARVPVFEVIPSTAFGFGRGELFSQTRWRFSGRAGATNP